MGYTEFIIPIKTFFVQNFIKLPSFFIMFANFLYFLYNLGDLCHSPFLIVNFLSNFSNVFSLPFYSIFAVLFQVENFFRLSKIFSSFLLPFFKSHDRIQHVNETHMREWLSWWSTTLPRLGSRVRVPSRALQNTREDILKRISFFIVQVLLGENVEVSAPPQPTLHVSHGIHFQRVTPPTLVLSNFI